MQGKPFYATSLKPEFWADRTTNWENHFVTMAKKIDGQIIYRQIPINASEYLQNPTEWPRGATGERCVIYDEHYLYIYKYIYMHKYKLQHQF